MRQLRTLRFDRAAPCGVVEMGSGGEVTGAAVRLGQNRMRVAVGHGAHSGALIGAYRLSTARSERQAGWWVGRPASRHWG